MGILNFVQNAHSFTYIFEQSGNLDSFLPVVFQSNSLVEHQMLLRRILVVGEITNSLELQITILLLFGGILLDEAVFHHLQRIWIQQFSEIFVAG